MMDSKTKVTAEDGKHDRLLTREFDLPVELLFKGFVDPEIIVQWKTPPGTTAKISNLESRKNGSFQMQGMDAEGKVVFTTRGVIHELIPNLKIIRTFQVEGAPMGVQLEVYDFEKLADETSRLKMHVIYETVAQRDMVLKSPASGNMDLAFNRLQELLVKVK
jgi:uncharacterized protein YndB with AHSA1/START domain